MTSETPDKNSMLYWYPKIKDLPIPQPRTEIVMMSEQDLEMYYHGDSDTGYTKELVEKVRKVIEEKFKLPIFIRTDHASGKHMWKKSCFVNDIDNLERNIFEVIIFNRLADIFGGLNIKAMIIRDYIPMKNLFTAFVGEMPVNPEVRIFVKDGKIQCWHWYWTKEAIKSGTREEKLPRNWEEILDNEIESISCTEISTFIKDAIKVAEVFKNDGLWSVDFCKAKDGRWILIDMAEGKKSWHPECKINEEENKNAKN